MSNKKSRISKKEFKINNTKEHIDISVDNRIISENLRSILLNSKLNSKFNPNLNSKFIKKLSFNTKRNIHTIDEIIKLNNNNLTKEKLTNISNIFNHTKHGIEYYLTSQQINKSNKKYGGVSLTLAQLSITEISNFCSAYKGTPENINNNITQLLIDSSGIYNNYQNIKNFVRDNYTTYEAKLIIQNLQHYNYYISTYSFDNKLPVEIRTFTRSNTYYEYNKNIIMAYELPQFQYNINNYINDFVEMQQQYLNSLSDKDKNIVKDYIHPNANKLLQAFINNGYSPGFIDNYMINNGVPMLNHEMGNAFCDYIEEYITINDIMIDINELKSKQYLHDAHEIYNTISEEIWSRILLRYLQDLNNIILNAPPVEDTMITYRGSSTDYINIQTQTATGIDVFISNRISSFTFNYDEAKKFYNKGTNNSDKTLYRVAITPGSRVLFISSFAPDILKDELEILTPINQHFHASENWDRTESWNSFKNKNNICLFDEDKINSKDLVLLNI